MTECDCGMWARAPVWACWLGTQQHWQRCLTAGLPAVLGTAPSDYGTRGPQLLLAPVVPWVPCRRRLWAS